MNSRVEYLFCPSFSLPLCHPQAWPTLARVILGRDEQEKYETRRACQHLLAKIPFNRTIKTSLKICFPWQMRAKPALHFTGTCLKRVVGLKMSLLESGKGIVLLRTLRLLCYMYARQMLPIQAQLTMHAFTVTKQYPILLQIYTETKKPLHKKKKKIPSIFSSLLIQITFPREAGSLNHSPQMFRWGDLDSPRCIAGVLLNTAAPSWYVCVCACAQRLLCCSCGLLTLL